MIVVDASCLSEVLINGRMAERIRSRLAEDPDHAAPHIIDVETFGVIRRLHLTDSIDKTTAALAIEDLALWPGERFGHRALLDRAWALRENVRGWMRCTSRLLRSLMPHCSHSIRDSHRRLVRTVSLSLSARRRPNSPNRTLGPGVSVPFGRSEKGPYVDPSIAVRHAAILLT